MAPREPMRLRARRRTSFFCPNPGSRISPRRYERAICASSASAFPSVIIVIIDPPIVSLRSTVRLLLSTPGAGKDHSGGCALRGDAHAQGLNDLRRHDEIMAAPFAHKDVRQAPGPVRKGRRRSRRRQSRTVGQEVRRPNPSGPTSDAFRDQ